MQADPRRAGTNRHHLGDSFGFSGETCTFEGRSWDCGIRARTAFRSFLRTVVHEFLHHLDYEHFKFPETFHTEGFYKRESSLANALFAAAGIEVPPPRAVR